MAHPNRCSGVVGKSQFELFRNYQQALKAAGFQTLYACEVPKCETDRAQPLIQKLPRKSHWKIPASFVEGTFNGGEQPGFKRLNVRKPGPSGVTYVTVAMRPYFEQTKTLQAQSYITTIRAQLTLLQKSVIFYKNLFCRNYAFARGLFAVKLMSH